MTGMVIGVLAVGLVVGCRERPAADAPGPPEGPGATSRPDSLVLTTADGFAVWLTDVRSASDSAGRPCEERSLEIRRDTLRLRVPLFYTRAAPTLLDPDHLRGELSRDCRTMAIYRIEIATGRPYKLEDR